jgi:hypothetical protein
MNRLLSFFAALILAAVAVSSACVASPNEVLSFRVEPTGTSDRVHVSFRINRTAGDTTNWSSSFTAAELGGLDLGRLRRPGNGPLTFAVAREAGRLDCAGTGGGGYANGSCRFTASPAFQQALERHGYGRVSDDHAIALMAVNAHADLLNVLAAARYPRPSLDDYIALSALNVTGNYIGRLAQAGYRPGSTDALIQFAALNITPEFIAGFARIGYGNLPADELVQLKALNITPAFVAGFERIGYGRLPVDKLVQLKALDVTPEFIQSLQRSGILHPSPDEAVRIKALGFPARSR